MISPIGALLLWMVISPLLFAIFSAKRAAMICFVFGWLFLPKASYAIAGLPDVSPSLAIAFGVMLGLIVFSPASLLTYRFRAIDLCLIALVVAPLAASWANGLGLYNGISSAVNASVKWGVPFIVGRILIRTIDDARELAFMLLLGVLAYVPLAIWEARMSPNLSYHVYGFRPFEFKMTRRLGGWRPVAFLSHGIEMGMLLATGVLVALSIWRSRVRRQILGVPMGVLVTIIIFTLIASSAFGGWVMCLFGLAAYAWVCLRPSRHVAMLVVLVPVFYLGARISGAWDGAHLVDAVGLVSEARAKSLEFRLMHETQLKDHGLRRPVFGWGGWGRNRVKNELGHNISVTDGLWVIIFTSSGFFGLIGFLGVFLGPPLLVLRQVNIRLLVTRPMLPILALIILMPVIVTDLLFNAFVGPSVILVAGGLVGACPAMRAASIVFEQTFRRRSPSQLTPTLAAPASKGAS